VVKDKPNTIPRARCFNKHIDFGPETGESMLHWRCSPGIWKHVGAYR
jgi:hypothetical protein